MKDIQVNDSYDLLVGALGELIQGARRRALQAVNEEMVQLYWEIGRHIVEYEQKGSDRAQYGKNLLPSLADDLTMRYGKGFSRANLQNMRVFYRVFPIRQAVPSKLSWTHLLLILRVENELARQFYINQCRKERWSSRQLERQINSMFFERIALSKDKKGVLELAKEGQLIAKPEDLMKDPFVFEFLGLPESCRLTETDLESRLINHLENFLLELGSGFCFIGRQKRITIGKDHFYIDLVFYHKLLKSFVLTDLKMEPFKPSDVGQMNFYLTILKRLKTVGMTILQLEFYYA